MFHIPQNALPVEMLSPATDAAGRTSAYVSLKNMQEAFLVLHITQGNAATIQIDPLQASAVAGTGSKAVTACPIFANQDAAAAVTLTQQTAAANFTTSAAVKHKIVVFHIVPSQHMDVSGGFDCLAVSTGASNAANITQAMLYAVPRYQGATAPTVLTD